MRRILNPRFAILPVLAATILASGCEGDATGPTPLPQVQALEVFTGPMDPMGINTYLFTTQVDSTVQVMLAGAVADNPLRSLSPVLHTRLSRWNGTECETIHEIATEPRLTAVLHRQLEAGTYCVSVVDTGSLTEPVGIVLRVVAPVLVSTGGSPGTDTFTNVITPGGTATRTFEASRTGVVNITFTGLTPAGAEMGLGLGLLATDGSGCKLTRIVRTPPGASPQITTTVDAGDYCVRLFDIGNVAGPETFSMTIGHP